MTQLKENLRKVETAIEEACRRAGRSRADVELMAVSKTYPAATIAEAASLGLRLFGENRVQEFAAKAPELTSLRAEGALAASDAPILVHLIGHLQSNKAQRAAEIFDAVDSLDSLRLAERLNEAAGKLGKRLPVLIEVKLSPEETKAGLDPESADAARTSRTPGRSGTPAYTGAHDHRSLGRRRKTSPEPVSAACAAGGIAGRRPIRSSTSTCSPWG